MVEANSDKDRRMNYYHVIGRPTAGVDIDDDGLQLKLGSYFCGECRDRILATGAIPVCLNKRKIKGRLLVFGSPGIAIVEHAFIKALVLKPEEYFWFGEVLAPSGQPIQGYSTFASRLRVVPIRARAPLQTEPCRTCERFVFTGYDSPNRYVVAPRGLRHEIYESGNGGLFLREDIFMKAQKLLKGLRVERVTVEAQGFDGVTASELEYEDQELPQDPNKTAARLETVALPQEREIIDSSIRYTGENPPEHVLLTFPNWIQALDEEGIEGQDETTLKPDETQTVISADTQHTAADAIIYSGKSCAALLSLENGRIESVTVYDGMWSVRVDGDKWQSEKWAHDTRYHGNTTDFPITIKSRLRYGRTLRPIELQLFPDGSVSWPE